MDTEKKYTEEEIKAMETDEISPDELEHVSGGHHLKDGTLVTDEIIDGYAEMFKNSGMSPDAMAIAALEFGFPDVTAPTLRGAVANGVHPADAWKSIVKQILAPQNGILDRFVER